MSIFNIDFSNLTAQLVPPILRQPKQLAWFNSMSAPLQYNNNLFNEYITGSTYNKFSVSSAYTAGNRVVYSDRSVYENLTGSTGVLPTDIYTWEKVNNSYIGATERSSYNAQKYLYEYALNRFFQLTGITRSSYFGMSATNIWIQTLTATSQSFIMGQTGPYSDDMCNISTNATAFMFNSYLGPNFADYTIWVPQYIWTATTEAIVRSFADTVNLAGIQYSVSGY